DRLDAVQPAGADHDRRRHRKRASREAGASAAGNERDLLVPEEPHHGRHLLGRSRQDDDVRRRALERVTVALVHRERVGIVDDGVVADKATELGCEAVPHAEVLTWTGRSSRPLAHQACVRAFTPSWLRRSATPPRLTGARSGCQRDCMWHLATRAPTPRRPRSTELRPFLLSRAGGSSVMNA